MQLFSLLAFVSAVSAIAIRQDVPTPPQCAIPCLTGTDTHGCSITDNSCLCRNSDFITAQTACISQACTQPSDLQQAESFAQATCQAVGVTLTATATAAATASGTTPSVTSPPSTNNNAAFALGVTRPALLLAGVAAFALSL